jgi:hypothetical protein
VSRPLALLIALLSIAPATAHAGVLDEPATLTCDGRVTFPQRAFRNPTGAERGSDPAAQALREQIAAEDLPAAGWRTLARTGDIVVFHHGLPHAGATVTVGLVDGEWKVVRRGCRATRVVPGLTVAPLRLWNPPRLTARSRTIRVTLFGGGCVRDPLRRLRRIEVRETRHTVTVLVLLRRVRPPPPGVSCPSDQIIGFKKVRLRHPLGRRAIRDARTFPARTVRRPK